MDAIDRAIAGSHAAISSLRTNDAALEARVAELRDIVRRMKLVAAPSDTVTLSNAVTRLRSAL